MLLTFIVPAVLIFIFGNIFGGQNGSMSKATVIFVNESNSFVAKYFEQKLDSSVSIKLKKTFRVEEEKKDYPFTDSLARQWVKQGKYSAALIFPEDFFADTSSGLKIKIYYDPKNDVESSIIEGAIQESIMGRMSKLFPLLMQRQTQSVLGDLKANKFVKEFQGVIKKYFLADMDSINFNVNLADSSYLFGENSYSAQSNMMNNMVKIEAKVKKRK